MVKASQSATGQITLEGAIEEEGEKEAGMDFMGVVQGLPSKLLFSVLLGMFLLAD